MTDEDPFLATIRDHPSDYTPRLVYADWLDENGHSDRAEYLRLVVEIAHREENAENADSYVGRLLFLSRSIAHDWRVRVGLEYRAILEEFDSLRFIALLRLIRERFGLNYAEAVALTKNLPTTLAILPTREDGEELKTTFEARIWSVSSFPSMSQIRLEIATKIDRSGP